MVFYKTVIIFKAIMVQKNKIQKKSLNNSFNNYIIQLLFPKMNRIKIIKFYKEKNKLMTKHQTFLIIQFRPMHLLV